MAETYTAGYVTAYGAAVRGGYTGTYEEFCAEQAKFAENAADVAQAKADVETMQGQVEQATATFTGTTVPAAVAIVQEAGAAQVQAVQSEGTTQAAAVETVGAQQTAAVGAAGSDAVDAVEAAETAATGAVTAAQTAAVQAVQTESTTQQAAIQTKGQETIDSIPSDYTALSNEVDDLKSSIKLYTGNEEIQFSDPSLRQYINTSGSTVSWDTPSTSVSTNIKWAVVECSAGDKFTINGKGGSADRLWAFADSEKNILSNASAGAIGTNLVITAPLNAAYLIINDEINKKSYIGEFLVEVVENLTNEVAEFAEFNDRVILNNTPSFTDGVFVYSSGAIGNSDALALSDPIPVENVYRVYSGFSANYCIAYYDEDLQFISMQDVANSTSAAMWVILSPPENAKYIRFDTRKTTVLPQDTKVEYFNAPRKNNSEIKNIESVGIHRNVELSNVEQEGYINLSGNTVNAANFYRTTNFKLYKGEHVTIDADGYVGYVTIFAKYNGATYTPIAVSEYDGIARYEIDITETGYYACSYRKRTALSMQVFLSADAIAEQFEDISVELENDVAPNICDMYDKFIFIGDSLTWSQVYTSDSNQRKAFKTYPQIFATLCGGESYTYANPGDSAVLWWERSSTGAFDNHGLYFVFLGTNGGFTDTIETDCVGTDPSAFASTQTGQYGRILQTIANNGDHAVLILPYGGGGSSLTTTREVIGKFSTKYNFPTIDINSPERQTAEYHYFPDKTGRNDLHFNDLGYAWLANEVLKMTNELSAGDRFKIMRTQ